MTTIKLSYWTALTAWELLAPRGTSVGAALVCTAVATVWAVRSARRIDLRAGGIARSLPAIATTFVTASVVAAPGSLPLLLVERQRSIEGCAGQLTCHGEQLLLWVAVFAAGFLLIPAAFAVALRRGETT